MTNPIKSLLLFCSGASSKILAMKACEVEHNKYAGIGGTILFTALLASLSGGYAMFTVFESIYLAIAFGLLWGLVIFNLDRFIVSTMKKSPRATNLSTTKSLTTKGGELRKAIPRLVLAIFIAIVITKPLELRLFQSEIKGQITQNFVIERTRAEATVNEEYADIPALEVEAEHLRKRMSELETERNKRIHAAAGEGGGFAGTGKAGYGPIYAQRKAEADRAEKELKAFQEKYQPILDAKEKEINQRKNEKSQRLADAKAAIDNSGGLLKKLEGLSTLASRYWSVFWANLFIIFLFVSIEIAPILAKVFSSRGPYDDCLDAEEHAAYAEQQKEMSNTNDNINTSVALSRQVNAERLITDAPLSMTDLQTLAPQEFEDAQKEIARRSIELWKVRQLNYLNSKATQITSSTLNAFATSSSGTTSVGSGVAPVHSGVSGPQSQNGGSAINTTLQAPVVAAAAAAGGSPTSSNTQASTP
jgi:hypothetical protein